MEMPFILFGGGSIIETTKEEMTTHGNHMGYGDLAQRTNYFFTVPIFPSSNLTSYEISWVQEPFRECR